MRFSDTEIDQMATKALAENTTVEAVVRSLKGQVLDVDLPWVEMRLHNAVKQQRQTYPA